jgi:YidC/Oxa1 family membrane protein insertase
MQDQGKRLLLAVGLALVALMVWQMIFSPKNEDEKQKAQQKQAQVQQLQQPRATTLIGAAPPAPGATPAVDSPIVLKFPSVVATFSNKGGVLRSWQLTDKRYEHDDTKGDLLGPDGAFHVGFTKDSTVQLPAQQDWVGKQLSDRKVEYTYSTPQLDFVKDYEVDPEAYIVKLKLTVTPKTTDELHQSLALSVYAQQDPKKAEGGTSRVQARAWESATLREGETRSTGITSLLKDGPRWEQNIQWAGFEQPYLLVGFAPAPIEGVTVDKYAFGDENGVMRTDLVWKPQAVFRKGAAQPLVRDVVGYLGPKNYDQLGHADEVAGFSTGFSKTIDLGWFAFIGRPLLWLLLKFHDVLGNWGLAILLLTMLVKAATLYWTTKSIRSMKAMAVLGPQMKALQEKYKDNKQKAQIETMALYKQNGVNPLAGCLPILLQMPIWLALYRMLMSAGELYQQPFISGWIGDLTNTDPYYILPIVLVITMFAQARLQPTTVDPSQRMQQRLMQYGMPLMFGVFCFGAPAGLTLYILMNTCLSAAHSLYMNKYDKKTQELTAKMRANQEAAKTATDASAAKAAKDANPSKDETAKETDTSIARTARANQPRRKKGRR